MRITIRRAENYADQIIDMYVREKLPISEIASKLDFSYQGIRQLLIRHDVQLHRTSKTNRLNPETVKEICGLYKNGNTSEELADIYSLNYVTILNLLRKNNVPIRKATARSPILNHDYFHNIDTKEKAYFLGWMITDGSISGPGKKSHPNPTVKLSMTGSDKYILEKFLIELGGDTKRIGVAHKEREHPMAAYSFTSCQMANDLAKYGVVPNKTWITFLPRIRDDLISHLIRGIFDGNGTITQSGKYQRTQIGFFGSEKLCYGIRDCLHEQLGFKLNKVSKSTCYHVWYSSIHDIEKFFDYIYRDSEGIRLERKYSKFLKCFDSYYGNTEVTRQIRKAVEYRRA